MPTTTVISTDVVQVAGYTYADVQDHLLVLAGASLVVTGAPAVSVAGGNTHYLTVDGLLMSTVNNTFTALLNGPTFVTVGDTGAIRGNGNNGFSTVLLGADILGGAGTFNGSTLVNAGEITATIGAAIASRGTFVRVVNEGLIAGGSRGVQFESRSGYLANTGTVSATQGPAVTMTGLSTLVNSGTLLSSNFIFDPVVLLFEGGNTLSNSGLIAGETAIRGLSEPGSGQSLTNTGRIEGAVQFLGTGVDILRNMGTIIGNLSLDGGDDLFDGIGGTVLGDVFGGTGNDVFRVSDSTLDLIEEVGGGIDRVEATVDWILGAGLENLTLLGASDLTGTGNSLANQLTGNAGANRMFGLNGIDRLDGGAGDDTLSGGTENDTVNGQDGDDRLLGGAGNDNVWGGNGEDVLFGGAGNDRLFGGADEDRFVFQTVAQSSAAAADLISDYEVGTDLIDLSQIDAVAGTAANDAFTFIGTGAFTNVAGQLRLVTGATTQVQGDVNGDGVADMVIRLTGNLTLTTADFVL